MSARKTRVTVTIDPHVAAYAERLVEAGKASSVSALSGIGESRAMPKALAHSAYHVSTARPGDKFRVPKGVWAASHKLYPQPVDPVSGL